MIELLFGSVDISTPIDCLLGLTVVVSVSLAIWAIWRHRD